MPALKRLAASSLLFISARTVYFHSRHGTTPMTPEQIHLVKDSWAKLLPVQEDAAEIFYHRLFDIHPEVKPYFKGNMKEQGKKLITMIDTTVSSLDNLDALMKPLKQSGKAHEGYDVKPEDYDKVSDALLWTLEKELGDDFTAETSEAWAVAYTVISSVMIDGARNMPAPKPRETKQTGCRFCARYSA